MLIVRVKTIKNSFKKTEREKSKKMAHQLSQSSKAIKERRFRQRELERKRFDQPLRKFIQHKYSTIYDEYTALYNVMVRNHPGKRDLSKTTTFKAWVTPTYELSDILSTAIRETIDVNYNNVDKENEVGQSAESEDHTENEVVHAENEAGQTAEVGNEAVIEDEAENEVHTENEVVDAENEAGQTDEVGNEVVIEDEAENEVHTENEVDAIINELMQDEAIRNVLDSETEDEGIGINLFDEIAFDIEPFDYELEVEGVDW